MMLPLPAPPISGRIWRGFLTVIAIGMFVGFIAGAVALGSLVARDETSRKKECE